MTDTHAGRRRNVVVILCDQLRTDYLSAYGGQGVPTPNIDRLARHGVVFDRAITQAPVCAPARATMMTGRYVSDHQMWTNNIPPREGLEYLGERMTANGYATGAFGHLHHWPVDDPRGFQRVSCFNARTPYLEWLQQRHPEATRIWNVQDYTFKYSEEDYYEHWIASEAIDFITEQASTEQPWLAWISFQGPHGPYDPPREVKGSCDPQVLPPRQPRPEHDEFDMVRYCIAIFGIPTDEEYAAIRTAYAEMIVEIDRQIGRVLDTIDALGLWEDTTFIFSADHGDMMWDFGITTKGPYPQSAHLNIPMIVSNHPAIAPGTRSAALVGNIDIAGTVLDIAGDPRPLGVSRSLLDLGSASPRHPRQVNYCESADMMKLVEDERYRFCYYPFSGQMGLYDLQDDPLTRRNLAGLPEYMPICMRFLQHIIEYQIIAKGVQISTSLLIPPVQEGLAAKHPHFREDIPIAYPLTRYEVEQLRKAGLPADYNEFCRGKEILAAYLPPYWAGEEK